MSKFSKPHRRKIIDDFRRWEIGFNAEMKLDEANLGKAWSKLIEERCDPDALKSALYYAAVVLTSAYELPQRFDAFSRAKEETLAQLAKLKKALESLMLPSFRSQAMADRIFRVYGVARKHVRFFRNFPSTLQRFEDILEFVHFPRDRPGTKAFSEIARGEALLHLYVEETTGRMFPAETAILLKAAAEAYDVKHLPSYDVDAVNRRYRRWFRARKDRDYRNLKALVREIKKHDGARFLGNFLEVQVMTSSMILAAYAQLMREHGGHSFRTNDQIGHPLLTVKRPPRFRRFTSRNETR